MPVFIAFAAFLLVVFGHRFGLPIQSWIVPGEPFGAKRKSPGQKSGVRTTAIEMVLDHDSGRMDGRCLRGRFAGRELSALIEDDLLLLLDELRTDDPQGAVLIEAYLDRRLKGWRERKAENRQKTKPSPRDARMTVNEARDVLGLKPGAKEEQIRAAHRRLMMKFHPDQGGSTYLAARINEAKEVLIAAS
jgi:DnaJ-like protein